MSFDERSGPTDPRRRTTAKIRTVVADPNGSRAQRRAARRLGVAATVPAAELLARGGSARVDDGDGAEPVGDGAGG